HQELTEIWETVLLHQFHDILPGSSIAWVHREARATYRDLEQRLRRLAARAVDLLAKDDDTVTATRRAPTSDGAWQREPIAPAAADAGSAGPADATDTATPPSAQVL